MLDANQAGDVKKSKAKIVSYGDPVTPDRVVSQLTFGFWVAILSRPYDARLWSAHNAAPLKRAFLRIPRAKRQRQTIHQQYNAIRELRNRVFHHEPLFDDQRLLQRYGETKRGLHWLNPKMVECLELYDRFPEVYAQGRGQVETILTEHLGNP